MWKHIEKFIDWMDEKEPKWASFVVFLTLLFLVAFVIMAVVVGLLVFTRGLVLLAIPCVIVYAFYLVFLKGGHH